MANQSVGTPRFYIDYTQLAKVKGFWVDRGLIGGENSYGLTNDSSSDNMRVWNFDYSTPQTYYMPADPNSSGGNYAGSQYVNFFLYFWNPFDHASTPSSLNLEWAKLVSTINWGGIINHNFGSSFENTSYQNKSWKMGVYNGGIDDSGNNSIDSADFTADANGWVNQLLENDGYAITTGNFSDEHLFGGNGLGQYASVYFNIDFGAVPAVDSEFGKGFDMGALCFGKYIDMPKSPDLSLTKTVSYEGVKSERSLGGADYTQVDYLGTPDWLSGEPWTLTNQIPEQRAARIGKNGRRSWKMSFSYLSNDDVFYDHTQPNVLGTTTWAQGYQTGFAGTNEIQQLWDLTLGGAIPFIFSPDKDASNPEYAICRLDQSSISAKQVAFQTWNISMRIEEVW